FFWVTEGTESILVLTYLIDLTKFRILSTKSHHSCDLNVNNKSYGEFQTFANCLSSVGAAKPRHRPLNGERDLEEYIPKIYLKN
uniref:hypothetical protein n=1 Tax=Leptospira kirschneri TaxID=29507 RepID=UPI001C4E214E